MKDNWGDRARFGMFIVGNEAVPEAEWWAMAPAGVSIHAARVTARAPWARWDSQRRDVVLESDLERGAAQFAAMRLSAAVVAHISSSIIGGAGWDEAIISRLSQILGGATHITTNGIDCIWALHECKAKRPFLVLPPWFDQAFAERAVAYLNAGGFEVSGYLIHTPDAKWRGVEPADLYRKFMHLEQRVDTLSDQIVAGCPPAADAVLIAGTGFRCVAILDSLERVLNRPVVASNQASLWNCLRLAGCQPSTAGYGQLLRRD
jgi:maleate isomerase